LYQAQKNFSVNIGTVPYKAPELIIPNSDEYQYDFSVDIWSYGCVLGSAVKNITKIRSSKGFSFLMLKTNTTYFYFIWNFSGRRKLMLYQKSTVFKWYLCMKRC